MWGALTILKVAVRWQGAGVRVRVVCLRSMGSPEATHMDETVGNVAALMASEYASPLTANIINVTCGEIAD